MPDDRHWLDVGRLFLRLGLTSFGGPAAHTAIMHDEVVTRRRWLSDAEFLDLVAATNLLPGPNSTEMAIHLGRRRAGWPGFFAAGFGFILPATLIVLVLSIVYVRVGTTPQAGWLLYGVKPVVIAILVQALFKLGQKAIRNALILVVSLAALGAYFTQVNEILILLLGGAVLMLAANLRRLSAAPPASLLLWLPALAPWRAAAVPFSLPLMFFTFLKIGAVLYGSGYVLFAFLSADFVNRLGWITQQQLVDAIAIGQVTPGPLFTSATFIGYLLAGTPGALLATIGMFLPSFVFVALAGPLLPRLQASPWTRSFLDGVVAASLGLMAAVTLELGRAALIDPATIVTAAAALFLLLRYKVNSTWMIAGGAVVGVLVQALR
ncbi:MAG TPA: chromate efflux transporter [Anaerolineales bacterium]|nr:chromate efflux transporter [Anaerolineales bacterium]